MKSSLIKKLTLLNNAVLEGMGSNSEFAIAQRFIRAGVKMLKADYGFCFIKSLSGSFELKFKTKSTPYIPSSPRKHGIVIKAFTSKKPQLITYIKKISYIKKDAKQNMASVAVIPIHFKNSAYGTLHYCFTSKRFFTEEEKELCAFLGNGAAQALTINKLHQRLNFEKKNLKNKINVRTSQLEKINTRLEEDKASDEALLSSLGEGIIATDNKMNIILINAKATELLGGGDVRQYLGKPVQQKMPLYDANNMELSLKERPTYLALTKGYQTSTNTARHFSTKRKDGTFLPISITVTPIVFKGKITGAIQIIRDITEEKRIDTAKSELISLASHQLRTPLAAINWYTEALLSGEMGKLVPDQKKYLKQIFSANQKMIELVYDFLNVSRIELGTFTLKISKLDLKEVAEDVQRELEPQITAKNITVCKKFGKGLGELDLDRKIIRIIFQNLLSNSVKYTGKNGKIKLDCKLSENQEELHITEEDNGMGIPKNQQDKIFQKLFRADNIQKLDTEGTGLGLYIVKALVDFCKGSISFKSEENKGTKFTICLPLKTFKQG